MGYDHGNRQNRMKAGTLLADMKSRFPSLFAPSTRDAFLNMLLQDATPYWRLSNVTGVHVYQAAGGWHADLSFKNLPVGMPTIVGTTEPRASRREAMVSALSQLSICAERQHLPLPTPGNEFLWFRFDEVAVAVDPGIVAELVTWPELPGAGRSVEVLRDRFANFRRMASGDEAMTTDAYDALPGFVRNQIRIACTFAFVHGMSEFTRDDPAWMADTVEMAPGSSMTH